MRLFGGSKDGLSARGELGTRLRALTDSGWLELHTGFAIGRIEAAADGSLRVTSPSDERGFEGLAALVAATDAQPDLTLTLTLELRVRLDPWLESTELLPPLIDPNEHSCGTVRPQGHRELAQPEARFYAIGAKTMAVRPMARRSRPTRPAWR